MNALEAKLLQVAEHLAEILISQIITMLTAHFGLQTPPQAKVEDKSNDNIEPNS